MDSSPLPVMPENRTKDLSADQFYACLIYEAIKTGHVSLRLALLKKGPVNHSRWLITANRILRIWCSKHGFRGQNYQNLKEFVEYIMKVYLPCSFNNKMHACDLLYPDQLPKMNECK